MQMSYYNCFILTVNLRTAYEFDRILRH